MRSQLALATLAQNCLTSPWTYPYLPTALIINLIPKQTTSTILKIYATTYQKLLYKRLCKLSKKEEVFNNVKGIYQNA